MTHLLLLGDSMLDDFAWLAHPKHDLSAELEQAEWVRSVTNFAVDGTTTYDLLERHRRDNSWTIYEQAREHFGLKNIYQRYGNTVRPLDHVRQWMKTHHCDQLGNLPNGERMFVVLSVGGNDIVTDPRMGNHLHKPWRYRSLVADFLERYERILDKLSDVIHYHQIIVLIPHHPHASFGGTLIRSLLWWYVTPLVQGILRLCKQHQCNVVDLSQSVDYTDDTMYGTGMKFQSNGMFPWSPIEPSHKTHALLERLLREAVRVDSSSVYYVDRDSGQVVRSTPNPDWYSIYYGESKPWWRRMFSSSPLTKT